MSTNNLSDRIKQEKSEYENQLKQKEQNRIRAEEAERRYKMQKQVDLNNKILYRFLSFFGCLIITAIGWNLGIVFHDGSLFSGLFMQLLFLAGAGASLVTLIRVFMAFFDK